MMVGQWGWSWPQLWFKYLRFASVLLIVNQISRIMNEKEIDQYLSSFLDKQEDSDLEEKSSSKHSERDGGEAQPFGVYNFSHEVPAQVTSREEPERKGSPIVRDQANQYKQPEQQFSSLPIQSRTVQNIIETGPEAKLKYTYQKRGQRYETHNLGCYFFRSTLQFLKVLVRSNQIDKKEVECIDNFIKSKGSFKGFQQLFGSKTIRNKCLHFFSSKFVVECILTGGGLGLSKKLVMIKYLQKMRSMLFRECSGWKR